MAKANAVWKVRPHGPIERLAENLWWVQGSLPRMSLKRVMTIARLSDGRLVIRNGIALEEAAMREIEAWGTPAFLLVPNGWHRLDAPAYKSRYPALRVLTPRGSRARVAEVMRVDGSYEDFPTDDHVRLHARTECRAEQRGEQELPDVQRVIVSHEKIASGLAARDALRTAMRLL